MYEYFKDLSFEEQRGFLKGYIDLVFKWKDKFYIVDWKSNYLGNNLDDYSKENIFSVMKDNHYILQYYIYSVALNRYLSKRSSGYNYANNFGGIFYIFVRGVDPANPNNGIYYDCPSEQTILSLDNFFSGNNAAA